uniref:Regulator of chromosome condensation protein n=1 Tax=Pithovirus LCPAC401 TaxID=2506595 RepID=A0A481ZA85_9VIRU|nr:MAG: regulator of chromosome condensation protein [Pithovirus LCPAC401]
MSTFKIAAGGFSSFALNSKGEIRGFGPDIFRLITDIPKGSGYKDISTVFNYALAINSNNEIVGWGSSTEYKYVNDDCMDDIIEGSKYLESDYQVTNIPSGSNYVAISAGFQYSLALTSDGELVSWGQDHALSTSWRFPKGSDFVEISVGTHFAMALRSNGKIEAWGHNYYDYDIPTDLDFKGISAGQHNHVVLRKDGTIFCLNNKFKAPEGNYIAISTYERYVLALRTDNTLVICGDNNQVPKGENFIAISTGLHHFMALDSAGEITIWGFVHDKDVYEKYILS